MNRLIALILVCLTIPVPVMADPPNPKYIIGILNQNIANYKVLRTRGDITPKEYFDRSWKAYDQAAEDGNMPDLKEMAAFGRVKSGEFLDGKITEDQYRSAMVNKQEDIKNRTLAQLNMQDSSNLSWTEILALAAAVALVGAAAAAASRGNSTGSSYQSYPGTTYQSYTGNCQYTWQRAADGSLCGNRAASVRPGGR